LPLLVLSWLGKLRPGNVGPGGEEEKRFDGDRLKMIAFPSGFI